MNYRIAFLAEAERDIDDIEEYLSQFYAGAVRNFFAKFEEKVLTLRDMPYMYPTYDDDPFFRRMVFDEYLLFYSVAENRQLIIIHRILHSRRDVSRQILRFKAPE